MKIFKLPDLGEGLPDAEIVEWHVKVGDTVAADQPLMSVETAKAIVEIPCPYSGRISRLFGDPDDIVHTGDPLVEFDGPATEEQLSADTQHDTGTVVGELARGDSVDRERPAVLGHAPIGIKATPAVRALAHRMEVDLAIVTPSGPDGLITAQDVQRVAKILADVGPMEPIHGARRAMARNMTMAHAEVAAVTIVDDADVHAWHEDQDVSVRLICALIAACRAEPALNAWYDSHSVGRRLLKRVDLGIAVDTEDGLFVPVLKDISAQDSMELRARLDALNADARARRLPPERLRGASIILSNFGGFAGRYATPAVLPPTVAILGAGRVREEVVPASGVPAIHRILPLSLSFDHRAVTGGEAARFLGTVMTHLQSADHYPTA